MSQSFRARAAAVLRVGSRDIVDRLTAALVAATLVLVAGVLWGYRSSLDKDAQVRGGTLAFPLAEQTTRTVQAVDLTLAGLEPVLGAAPQARHAPAFEGARPCRRAAG